MDYQSAYTVEDIRRYLAGAQVVAFDFETAPLLQYRDEPKAALDPHRSAIVGISLSVREGSAIYVPLHHYTGQNAGDPQGVMHYLKTAVFMNTGIVKVAHNLAFEALFLYAQGIVIQPPVYDTIAAAQLTLKAPTQFRALSECGLKALATGLFGAEMQTFGDLTDGRHFDELDPADEATLRYACADADYALRLRRLFNQWFERYLPAHKVIVEDVESPTAIYVGLMKYNGILMDVETMRQKQTDAAERIAGIRAQIDAITGGVDIGANASTAAFKKYLYVELGLPVLKTTAKLREAADDQVMILLTEHCREHRPELMRLFELVQEYRRWGKIQSTYIAGYLKYVSPVTGRIHADLMPLATETGRFASRNPNLQNAPRKGNDPVGVRNFIVAPAGCVLLSLDFSQIELRVGAFYCRDEKMLGVYRDNGDIHGQTTTVIYGVPYDEAVDKGAPDYKERRTIAKNVNFGVFYGLFAHGLQRTLRFKAGLDVPLSHCERIIHNLQAGYPRLMRWQADVKRAAARHKHTETFLGRRRMLPGIASEDWGVRSYAERCALNTPIQGTAADILKLALGRIVHGLPDRPWLRPLLQIHDELVFELPAGRIDEAAVFIKGCMEAQPFPEFDVPIVAEAAFGPSFGEMADIQEEN